MQELIRNHTNKQSEGCFLFLLTAADVKTVLEKIHTKTPWTCLLRSQPSRPTFMTLNARGFFADS